jgi:hypothetical protein
MEMYVLCSFWDHCFPLRWFFSTPQSLGIEAKNGRKRQYAFVAKLLREHDVDPEEVHEVIRGIKDGTIRGGAPNGDDQVCILFLSLLKCSVHSHEWSERLCQLSVKELEESKWLPIGELQGLLEVYASKIFLSSVGLKHKLCG